MFTSYRTAPPAPSCRHNTKLPIMHAQQAVRHLRGRYATSLQLAPIANNQGTLRDLMPH